MTVRLHVPLPLDAGALLDLPPGAARHVQVLRLQPGSALVLFDGQGGEWPAEVVAIGRAAVQVRLGARQDIDRELPVAVTLAVGMPANDRMDFLVEKACELGARRLQPLVCERSVLRLDGERARKKVAHWQAVAVAASEQCGRNRVLAVEAVQPLAGWLQALPPVDAAQEPRRVLSPSGAQPWTGAAGAAAVLLLSGPEGGLAPAEEALARRCGFAAVTLGPRVLRADTAPLAALAALGLAG